MAQKAAFLYLHGFASGPSSSKAQDLFARFAERGAHLEVPDLNEGVAGFFGLTISRMLGSAREAAGRARRAAGLGSDGPLVVLGSSLGGYTSALFAAREPGVVAAVLLAPAFEFAMRLEERILREDTTGEVKRTGGFTTRHHAWERDERCGIALLNDGKTYEAFPDVRVPTFVLHGRKDDVVPPELSTRFAEGRANVRLCLVDDDHMLHSSKGRIWEETRAFLAAWLPEGTPTR